jgi:hypothetical protein
MSKPLPQQKEPTDETEEVPCYLCGGPANRQVCPGDGRYHHHGCVHLPERNGNEHWRGGLEAVCNGCFPLVEAEWQLVRMPA